MSFGFGISDVVTLVQLAYDTFEGAKRACGEHDEFTHEMASLVTVLNHVRSEISDPDSALSMARDHRRKELRNQIEGCFRHVRQINAILTKFNELSDVERGSGLLWQKVRFGNGGVKDIAQIRQKISTYTTAITMSLTLLSLGSRGEVERQLSRQRGELRGITESVNMLVAKLNAPSYEGSIWTKCTDDDPRFWRDFRRQLVRKGYRSRVIRSHECLIQAYVRELDSRGVLNGEIKHTQSSIDTEPDTEDPRLPELSADQDGLKVDLQHQDEVSEIGREEEDTSGHSVDQGDWLGEENTGNEARNYREPTVEDFEELLESDQVQGEDSALLLSDGRYEDEETWQGGETLVQAHFSPNTFEMAQRLEYLERLGREQQQLLQTMRHGENTTRELIRVYTTQPSPPNRHHVNLMPSSPVDQTHAGDSDRRLLTEPQSLIIDNTSTTGEMFNQDVDAPIDGEGLANARDEAFRALSSEERKVIITLQDPSGRRYSFPYVRVKTWDGMQYLVEQALLNVEDIGPRVAKGEYDLINSDGAVIIPHLWETFVEPDMLVTMQTWPPPSPQTPPASPQPPPALPTTKLSPPVPWTPPPSPQRPPPPRSSMPHPILVTPRIRSTSPMSSHKTSKQKQSRKSVTWSLFGLPSPSKAKSTMSRRLSLEPSYYRSYLPSYDSYDYDCTCWECHYSQIYSQERPSTPSPPVSQFKVRYPQIVREVVEPRILTKAETEYSESIDKVEPNILTKTATECSESIDKVEPNILTKTATECSEGIDKVEPNILTKAATECSESIDKIEPIFELGGGEIYELE